MKWFVSCNCASCGSYVLAGDDCVAVQLCNTDAVEASAILFLVPLQDVRRRCPRPTWKFQRVPDAFWFVDPYILSCCFDACDSKKNASCVICSHRVACMSWKATLAAHHCVATPVMLSRRENRIGAMTLFHCSTIGVSINIFIFCHHRYFNIVIFHIRVSIRVRGLHLVSGNLAILGAPSCRGMFKINVLTTLAIPTWCPIAQWPRPPRTVRSRPRLRRAGANCPSGPECTSGATWGGYRVDTSVSGNLHKVKPPFDSVQLVQITPISLWFMVTITIVFMGFINHLITGGPHLAYKWLIHLQ